MTAASGLRFWRETPQAGTRMGLHAIGSRMKIKVIVHEAEEGGYWAEVPAIPGCATQGENMEELLRNLREVIEGRLSVDVAAPEPDDKSRVLEIAL
jgi:predicted RNase H-like HicB family nuclease